MNLKLILAAVLVVGVGAGVVVAGDVLPGGSSEADSEPFPTVTPSAEETTTSGSGAETTTTDGTSTETPPFGVVIDGIEECGQTCRDVTSTLTNHQDTAVENVTVYARIFAGKGTGGDDIWHGQEDVGTLAAGEPYTTTERVELSFSEALTVENNDGWITVQTTVETDDGTVTFTDERRVA